MSRVGKKPIELGKDQSAEVKGRVVTIKGKKGSLTLETNSEVEVTVEGNLVKVAPRSGSNFANAMSGTTRAHLANMVAGVTKGFEKKLELVGVGYRAAVQGKKLNLTLIRSSFRFRRASRSKRRARTRSS
jgi:large subunit ribosomal protein L6